MSRPFDRRRFLKSSAIAGTGFWVAGGLQAKESSSANEKIQVACIGVGGKGHSDSTNVSRFGKVLAVCDVDRQKLEGMSRALRAEHKFTDYRELLDQLGDQIDAVTISTPDHCHATIASKAMKLGKHVYCQKPLTHSIWEARRLAEIAKETGVATQMGNQWTNYGPMRQDAARIRAGLLGTVTDVHIWTDRPIWPQGEARPPAAPVPSHLDWESWIGPAPWREYAEGAYHTFRWRGWWDFGTGALGDMACHTCNLPFMALKMRDPTSVQAETTGHNGDSYPAKSKIVYEFPELDGRAAFRMTWYDGGNLPPQELFSDFRPMADRAGKLQTPPSKSGALLIGDRATYYVPGDYGELGAQVAGAVTVSDFDVPYRKPTPPVNSELGHVNEWFLAISDPATPAVGNIVDYSGPLTETILLGNLAVWNAQDGQGDRILWDAKNLVATSHPELQKIVRREYRDGYEV